MAERARGDVEDTIVAVATAAGESAIGVIRVSGSKALDVVAPLVRPSLALTTAPSHVLRLVSVVDPATGQRIDEALCAVMRRPRSYTGEDVVELSCHGSPALLLMITRRLLDGGARLAEPGEFTRRAFLSGRIDLAQAEAVALLIGARTERAVTLAARALAGGLSTRVRAVREILVDVMAGLEVTLDFPEDAVGLSAGSAGATVAGLQRDVSGLVTSARRGRVVHEGITVALVGAPNAGKSSLLNALLGQDRAIVSPIPGTTRDVIDAALILGGVPVRLLDTAGIGVPRDPIEAEGVKRSRDALDHSDLLLIVVDGSVAPDIEVIRDAERRPSLLVRTKRDLPPHPAAQALDAAVDVSAHTGAGLDALVETLTDEVRRRSSASGDEGGIVASLRQIELLQALERALERGSRSLRGDPLEAALVDLREALEAISALLGEEVGDAVLDRVFASFCLGK